MRTLIDVRGYQIAVHARTGAQVELYRRQFAGRSDQQLARMAAETDRETDHTTERRASQARNARALERRAGFHIV